MKKIAFLIALLAMSDELWAKVGWRKPLLTSLSSLLIKDSNKKNEKEINNAVFYNCYSNMYSIVNVFVFNGRNRERLYHY